MDRIAEALDIVRRATLLGDYDSNVVGMAAEIIAEERFGMERQARGAQHIDGHWTRDGRNRSVQVKGWSSSRIVRYGKYAFAEVRAAARADDVLVVLIYCYTSEYDVLYCGPTEKAGIAKKNGLHRYVRLDHLVHGEELARIVAKCAAQNIR
ncbi:DUF6998 domain-containing protein [Methylibium sp.]|uniref:DUF6998 domain-containing protein n=1 Tax=Methylibium sp. TaxID=2067992 RepID=UPI003D1299DE